MARCFKPQGSYCNRLTPPPLPISYNMDLELDSILDEDAKDEDCVYWISQSAVSLLTIILSGETTSYNVSATFGSKIYETKKLNSVYHS